MSEGINNFLESRPQRLCHMCGRCCRMSTTPITYEEMQVMAAQGDKGAKDFLELFIPYESIEEARLVDARIVDNIVNALNNSNIYGDAYNEKVLKFYRCRHILDNNLCGIYQNRKELCDRFPSSPWAVIPPGCGFEGWIFQKREELKQKIRKQKENILFAQTLLAEATTPEQKERINTTIENIKNTISLYAKYGSEDW